MLIMLNILYILYNNQMLKKVVQNLGSLTVMRVLSRVVHFLLKTYLIRTQLDEQILAHMLHLDLILSASLHVVRSCFKPSYQKVSNDKTIVESSMNIMSFGIFATIISTGVVGLMEYYQFLQSGKILAFFTDAIALYCLSSVFESVAQKYMVEFVIKYEYLKIGAIEVISVIPKTVFIFWAAYFRYFQDYGLLIFGFGQLLYSATFMLLFFISSSNKSLFLQPIVVNSQSLLFDPKSKDSLKQFSFISLLKFVLQQFQQIVLVIMDTSHISSIYSLINNLGSIVVRYLFAPLNQIIFNHFSRGTQQQSLKALVSFVKSILIFSILVISFGYNYSQIFLMLLYGSKWVNEQSILAFRTYMALVVFLGLNGVIEAFLFARGKQSIKKYNYFSLVTTGIYLGSTILFLHLGLGTAGLFLGNIINMSTRIIICWYLQISAHIKFVQLVSQVKPSFIFIITSVIFFIINHKQMGFVSGIFSHSVLKLGLGILLFGLNLLPVVYEYRVVLMNEIKLRFFKKKKE